MPTVSQVKRTPNIAHLKSEEIKMATLSYAEALKKPRDTSLDVTTQELQQEAPTVVGMARGHSDVQEMRDETEPQSGRVTKPKISTVRNRGHTGTGEDGTVEEDDDEKGDNDSDNKSESEAEDTHWSSQAQLPILRGMTLQALHHSYDQERRKWKESQAGRDSCAAFRDALQRSSDVKIQTCVALGLGSFSGNHEGSEGNPFDASMAQLVAFEEYVDIIARYQGSLPPTFVQDPEFNSLDYQFLMSRGHSIIQPPASQAVTMEASFLYTPAAPYNVIWAELSRVHPALYLGYDILLDLPMTFENDALFRELFDFLGRKETVSVALSTYDRDFEGVLGPVAPPPNRRTPQDWEIWHPLYFTPKEYSKEENLKQQRARKTMLHGRFS